MVLNFNNTEVKKSTFYKSSKYLVDINEMNIDKILISN